MTVLGALLDASGNAIGGGGNNTFTASSLGAALDSDIDTGGGTDDTAILQTALDLLASTGGGTLIIDGVALVTNLRPGSNTHIRFNPGAGLFQLAGTDTPILFNKNWCNQNNGPRVDTNIHISGPGVLNCNGENQRIQWILGTSLGTGWVTVSSDGAGIGSYGTPGLVLMGATKCSISDITVRNSRYWNFSLGYVDYTHVRNITAECTDPTGAYATIFNRDGLNWRGPGQFNSCYGVTQIGGNDDCFGGDFSEWGDFNLLDDPDLFQTIAYGAMLHSEFAGFFNVDGPTGIRIMDAGQRGTTMQSDAIRIRGVYGRSGTTIPITSIVAGVVTAPGHEFVADDYFQFQGLVSAHGANLDINGAGYFVKTVVPGVSFTYSLTLGGAAVTTGNAVGGFLGGTTSGGTYGLSSEIAGIISGKIRRLTFADFDLRGTIGVGTASCLYTSIENLKLENVNMYRLTGEAMLLVGYAAGGELSCAIGNLVMSNCTISPGPTASNYAKLVALSSIGTIDTIMLNGCMTTGPDPITNAGAIGRVVASNCYLPNSAGAVVTGAGTCGPRTGDFLYRYTVATLPAANAEMTGMRVTVTNAAQTVAANIGAVISGTGANVIPATFDGTNWRVG